MFNLLCQEILVRTIGYYDFDLILTKRTGNECNVDNHSRIQTTSLGRADPIRATKIPVMETRAGSVTRLLHERSSLSIFHGLIEVIVTHVFSRTQQLLIFKISGH
jgi:hypothetical protein